MPSPSATTVTDTTRAKRLKDNAQISLIILCVTPVGWFLAPDWMNIRDVLAVLPPFGVALAWVLHLSTDKWELVPGGAWEPAAGAPAWVRGGIVLCGALTALPVAALFGMLLLSLASGFLDHLAWRFNRS